MDQSYYLWTVVSQIDVYCEGHEFFRQHQTDIYRVFQEE